MQLVENVQLLPPSICFICEGQPDGTAVVDTLYNFKPGVPSVLNGRKYVCERCVGEFAKLFGLESGDQVARAQHERDEARRELANVRDNISSFKDKLDEAINHPGVINEGQTFEDLFDPPDVDKVREASANRLSSIESRSPDQVQKPQKRKPKVRAAVPAPGLDVNEVQDNDNTVPEATIEAAKESDGSSGSESKSES